MSVVADSHYAPHYIVTPEDRGIHWNVTAHTFPTPVTAFVGRGGELAEVWERLNDPACRLLTLTGPGGIGKTRLALEAARQAEYPDGVYFLPLQSLSSPEQIIPIISKELPISGNAQQDMKARLFRYLRDKRLLLVLDNFEHLLDGVGLLSEILEVAPEVKLLVTSRERLHLMEEWVMDVQGLEIPKADVPDAAEHYSAVRLFVQCALRAGYQVRDGDMAFVIRICRLVSGCPLGIQLAAAWTRSLTCQQIMRELERGLDFLQTPFRNVEPRHRSLRAAFEPTWERLTEAEQALFMRLSVFRDSFTLEAAEQVAGASLQLLTALVDKSLLRLNQDGGYEIHELIRQYAEEKFMLEQLLAQAATVNRPATSSTVLEPLTERELEVLRLITEGYSNQAIADHLILSIGTVKWYSTQIYNKLGAQNRAQAVRRAQELNLFAQTQP